MHDLAALSDLPAVPAGPAALGPVALGPGEIDLWYAYVDESSVRHVAACLQVMDEAERKRQARFHFERDRTLYAVAHAMVRTALSYYVADVAPAAWRFETNEHGCPHVSGPGKPRYPWFNLSHTHGLVACAVSGCHQEVGVDVEDIERNTGVIEIADRFFSEPEVVALHRLPTSEQRDRFFAYWTLKESYIKARGMGLAIPLGHFSFLLDDGPTIGIAFADELPDTPAKWHFRRYRASPRHALSAALACGAEVPMQVRGRRWSPAELVRLELGQPGEAR